MIVYRIANPLYSSDISGNGARLNGARWNSKGIPMLYTAVYISLAALEMLVHSSFKDYSIALDLVYIHFPENETIKEINSSKLKQNWINDPEYTRFICDEFIKSKQQLILKVPSAVVNEETNYLINPLHQDFKKIKVEKIKSFHTDKRFFSI